MRNVVATFNVPERPSIILLFYLVNFMIFLPLPFLSPFLAIQVSFLYKQSCKK